MSLSPSSLPGPGPPGRPPPRREDRDDRVRGWADALNSASVMFGVASDTERIAAAIASPAPLPGLRAPLPATRPAPRPDRGPRRARPRARGCRQARMSLWKIAGIAFADDQDAGVARTLGAARHASPALPRRAPAEIFAVSSRCCAMGSCAAVARQDLYVEHAATASAAPRFSAYDFPVAVQPRHPDRSSTPWCAFARRGRKAATTEALH